MKRYIVRQDPNPDVAEVRLFRRLGLYLLLRRTCEVPTTLAIGRSRKHRIIGGPSYRELYLVAEASTSVHSVQDGYQA